MRESTLSDRLVAYTLARAFTERTRPGGHSDFGPTRSGTGCCAGHSQSLGRTCDGVPQALKATREELKAGADFIKIMCGGGVASPTVRQILFAQIENQSDAVSCHSTVSKLCSLQPRRSGRLRRLVIKWVESTVGILEESVDIM